MWIAGDWSAVEAAIVSHRCHDAPDLEVKRRGLDLHTVTAITILKYPDPPFEPTKENLASEQGQAWRDKVGFDGRTRTLIKNLRYCVPLDTQALTRRGWKGYHEVTIGEDVLTYNATTGMKEWAPVLDKVFFESVDVWEIKNSWLTLRATADHRWFIRQRARNKTGRCWENAPYLVDRVVTTAELNTHSNIILNAPMTPDTQSFVDAEMFRCPKYGVDWTQHIISMSSTERRSFLMGFLIADGHFVPKGGWTFSQLRGPLLEAAATCAFIEHDGAIRLSGDREGVKPGHPCVIGRLSRKQHMTGQRLTRRNLGPQPVWCITTRNGSWVIRQGDVMTITGNCLNYAKNEKAMARYAVELGMSKGELWAYGRRYLAAKPWLMTWKRQRWSEAWRRKEARTAFGRRRRLLGDQYQIEKEGLNHEIQGTVADMMRVTMVSLAREIPNLRMVLQRHDGWYSEVPEGWDEWATYKRIVEREWIIDGRPICFPADYEVIER